MPSTDIPYPSILLSEALHLDVVPDVKVRMPLAREVFATFERLAVSQNRWVLSGETSSHLTGYQVKGKALG